PRRRARSCLPACRSAARRPSSVHLRGSTAIRVAPRSGRLPAMTVDPFEALAVTPDAPLDELALALAAEFRPVDVDRALDRLDALAAEIDPSAIGPRAELEAVVAVLGGEH